MTTLGDIIGVILDPRFWMRIRPVSHAYDAWLNRILDQVDAGEIEARVLYNYTMRIGSHEIWVSNFPYGYGSTWSLVGIGDVIPKRKTTLRLRELEERVRYGNA